MKINDATNPLLNNVLREHLYGGQQTFEIQSLKSMSQRCLNKKFQNTRPHHYHIIWVTKGSGEHLIDVERYDLKVNHLYCVLPHQIQNLKANHDLEGYMISFSADFLGIGTCGLEDTLFSGRFNSLSDRSVIEINNELKSEIVHIVLKMKKEFNDYSNLKMEILRGYLKLFLIYLNRHSRPANQIGERISRTELVNNFFTLLREHFSSKKLVTEYANMLAVSPNYLNNIVKKVSGYPASHHIKQQILLEAKRQAMFTDKSMKEIAFQLGFEEKSHFSKFFKKIEGNNFSFYRKSIGKSLYL